MIVDLTVEWNQEGIVRRGRSETVNEFGLKSDDDDAGVELRVIDCLMGLEIVHDEEVAGGERNLLVANTLLERAVEREKEFEAMMPRYLLGDSSSDEVEETDL